MIAFPIALLTLLSVPVAVAQHDCNPLTTTTCPPIPGLPTSTYTVDFTRQTRLPDGWVLANYANVTFGPEGAKFWFNSRGQAPYIWTDFYIAYGRVDVELLVSNGTGIITSSVLFTDDQDEIDWEFSGSNFATPNGKAFTNYFGKGLTGNYDRASIQDVQTPQQMFHTYSFDWTPQTLRWIIDGAEKHAQVNSGQTTGNYQYPQTPARLHLGLWDAGDPNTASGTVNWAGGYTNYANAPYYAIVRSVKITTPYPCSSWQFPSNFSGKWADVKCTNQTVSSSSTSTTSNPTSSAGSTSPNALCTANSYSVAGGDYGWGVANRFGLSFGALSAVNAGVNWDRLNVGQVLNIPCNVTATSSTSSLISTTSSLSTLPNTSTASLGNSATGIPTSLTKISATLASSAQTSNSSTSIVSIFTAVFSTLSTTNSSASTSFLTITASTPLPLNTTSLASTSATANPTSTSAIDTALYAKCTSGLYPYKVLPGDYGVRIAAKFGVSFDNIYQVNPGVTWSDIKTGQILQIPCGYSTVTSIASSPGSTVVLGLATSSTLGSTLTNATTAPSVWVAGPPLLNTPTGSSISSSKSASVLAGVSTSLPQSWKYKSCFTDNLKPRSLIVFSDIPTSQMNNTRCVSYCDSRGFVFAGTEWSGECYCGMQITNARVANETECNMKCYANNTEMCGGDARLSVYYKDAADSANVKASSVSLTSSALQGSSSGSSKVTITPTSVISSPNAKTGLSSTVAAALLSTATSFSSSTLTSASSTCTSDQCFNYMTAMSTAASDFCSTFMNPARTITSDIYANVFAQGCTNAAVRISSACNCLTASSMAPATGSSVASGLGGKLHLSTSTNTRARRWHARGGLSWSKWRRRGEKQYDGRASTDGDTSQDGDGSSRNGDRRSVRAGRRAGYGRLMRALDR